MNIKHRNSNTGDAEFVFFSVHRRSTFTNVRQFVEHRGQLGNGIAG